MYIIKTGNSFRNPRRNLISPNKMISDNQLCKYYSYMEHSIGSSKKQSKKWNS